MRVIMEIGNSKELINYVNHVSSAECSFFGSTKRQSMEPPKTCFSLRLGVSFQMNGIKCLTADMS
jgi:hypothetical protein